MIHDEICTYDVCKLAKEKGFPVKEIECWYCEFDGRPTKEIVDDQQYPIISQSLLQRWLREEKEIHITVFPNISNSFEFDYIVYSKGDKFWNPIYTARNDFATYELALEDALKYALENLV